MNLCKYLAFAVNTLVVCIQREILKPITHKLLNLKSLERASDEDKPTLFQTHETALQPWSVYQATAQTVNMNPDYNYAFYTAAERRAFLLAQFGADSDQVRAYDMVNNGAIKADLFRICVLYVFGGVYMDCKSAAIHPFRAFIPPGSNLCLFLETNRTRVANSFIACTPKNALMAAFMKEATARCLRRHYGANPLDVTGPEMFGTVMRAFLKVDVLEQKRYQADGLNIDLIGTTHLFSSFMFVRPDFPVIKRQPDTYLFSLLKLAARYEWSWIVGNYFKAVPGQSWWADFCKFIISLTPCDCPQLNLKQFEPDNKAQCTGPVYQPPPLHPYHRKLMQTHESSYVDWACYQATAQTVFMNPEYEYIFFTGDERRQWLTRTFGLESPQVRAYDCVRNGAIKADLFRLCFVYQEGGVYLDCKAATIQPFVTFIPKDSDFAIFQEECITRLSNSFFYSAPKHELIARLMEVACSRVLNHEYGANPLDVTGPEMFGSVVRSFVGADALQPVRYRARGITVDILGRCNMLYNYCYIERPRRPVLKRQPDTYYFTQRLLHRHELAWWTGTYFQRSS